MEFSSAQFGDRNGYGLLDYADLSTDPHALEAGGLWFIAATFEGDLHAWRMTPCEAKITLPGPWDGPGPETWQTTMSREQYMTAVERVRDHIREGDVYQANVCRMLSAPVDAAGDGLPRSRAASLHAQLAPKNPAPYAGWLEVRESSSAKNVWLVSASPELFIRVSADGTVTSSPIKGTAVTATGLTDKDAAENIMIADLVRNDLHQVCVPDSVTTPRLLDVEQHPGLVHLVTDVQGRLRSIPRDNPAIWSDLLAATFPPASVSGAPKLAALDIIREVEPTARGPYCGGVGWIDVDAGEAQLAVGIRTFYAADSRLHFGTGAGITWQSDAAAEWDETELKAAVLIALASAQQAQDGD